MHWATLVSSNAIYYILLLQMNDKPQNTEPILFFKKILPGEISKKIVLETYNFEI